VSDLNTFLQNFQKNIFSQFIGEKFLLSIDLLLSFCYNTIKFSFERRTAL